MARAQGGVWKIMILDDEPGSNRWIKIPIGSILDPKETDIE